MQPDLFDQRDLASITAPDYPGERLIVCRNPDLGRERARKRHDLLAAAERHLARLVQAVTRKRRPLRGADVIGLRAGAVLNRHKVGKHFDLTITEHGFSFERKEAAIADEATLDGVYVIRTSLAAEVLDDAATVGAYKGLSQVERAFRSLKTVDLEIRPIHHWLSDRVRAHVFLCMLAYGVEWHMRGLLAPMLYDDADKETAAAQRRSVVAKAGRSAAAPAKETTGRTADGLRVHSFQSLLADLATLTRSTMAAALNENYAFTVDTRPTPIQNKAFELLGVKPERTR